MAAESSQKLLLKAGRLLARRAYARGELRARLAQDGGEEDLESVLDQLERINLLNDAEYAYNFALYRMRQNAWGLARIRRALILRHVLPDVIEPALDRVQQEVGERNSIEDFLEHQYQKRSLPTDRRGIQRLVLQLRRRGFDDEVIYSALRRMIQPAAWQRFETGD